MSKYITILLCLLVMPSVAFGATTLTQDKFIKQAIKNNPSYQISAQEYMIALEQNKSTRSLEDWNLVLSGLWNESSPPPLSSFSAQYRKTAGYTVGLEKYIADTGTAIQLEHSNTRFDSKYPPGSSAFNPPSKYYLSSISLTIVQPLLKNAWGLATKNALKMSGYSLKLAKIKLSEDWEDLISLLRKEYLTWQKCVKNISLVKGQVKTVKNQLALTKRQLKYGLSEELDVVQLEQKLEAYRIMLEQAILVCDTQTQKIFQLMGQRGANSANAYPDKFIPNGSIMDAATAGSYLRSSSNIKRTADILVDLQTTNLETKENAKQIDVNLVLSAKPNAFTEGLSDSLTKIGQYSEKTISVTASRPLGNDQAEAEAEKAKIEYNKSIKQRENILLNANLGLSSLYTNLKRLSNMVKLNENSLKLAKKRSILEKRKFNQGRSSVFFVLQADDDMLKAENSLNETIFSREEIINQIKTLTDRYLVEYKDVLKL
ncbi:MAG: TolC family protein [Candidatus Margulisiibacteriota bacterium]|nr:TolC family protein [Candidatus Margulisiibacteriota bacterium]